MCVCVNMCVRGGREYIIFLIISNYFNVHTFFKIINYILNILCSLNLYYLICLCYNHRFIIYHIVYVQYKSMVIIYTFIILIIYIILFLL